VGLTEFLPRARVVVNGEDITSVLWARLASLTIVDEAGVTSDRAEIELADHQPLHRLILPPTGAEIAIALGYDVRMRDMGLFVADEIEIEGPPDRLRIRAAASPHGATPAGKTALPSQKTRSWPAGTTIGDLVATLAAEHGLTPAVSASLKGTVLPHLDQIAESDINLLSRLARTVDAIAAPKAGRLVVARRGESLTASGQEMPRVQLGRGDLTSWRMQQSLRAPAGQVVAVWRDKAASADVEVTAGEGEPVRRLRETWPTKAAAEAAARAEYRRAQREGTQLSLTLPGDPDLVAEARLVVSGVRAGVDGEWLVTRVEHRLDQGGYRCSVRAEVPE